jgi:hypothetical protein
MVRVGAGRKLGAAGTGNRVSPHAQIFFPFEINQISK